MKAVFKWLSKIITRCRSLRLVIGLRIPCQVFNQREAKPIAPCKRDLLGALLCLYLMRQIQTTVNLQQNLPWDATTPLTTTWNYMTRLN